MCGLVYGKRKDGRPIAKSILKRYKNQSGRGKQGFGYVTIQNNKIEHYKRFQTESEMEKELVKEKSGEILFHHRFPTSTPNLEDLNHPILIESETFKHKYYFAHNGVISNDDDLKDKHEAMGLGYSTILQNIKIQRTKNRDIETITEVYNDSESLGFEVALYLEGLQSKIEAKGSIAFICIQTDLEDNVTKLFYGKNENNPLVLERDKNSDIMFLKSEGSGYKIDSNEIVSVCSITGDTEIETVNIGEPRYVYKAPEKKEEDNTKVNFPNNWFPRNKKEYGFDTRGTNEEDVVEYPIEYEDTPNDDDIIQQLSDDLETKMELLCDDEQMIMDEIKDIEQQIASVSDKYQCWELGLDLEDKKEELVAKRKEMSRVEDEIDSLAELETEVSTIKEKQQSLPTIIL